ncbi:MAG: hypothetical protein IKS05_06655, partial [Oscillospiraceae bacterium]|nr:hypothetical protein [Oscillospiraceae bacterium]
MENEKQAAEVPVPKPAWLKGKQLNEILFCQELLQEQPLVYVGGSFYSMDGRIDNQEKLAHRIYEKLKPWVSYGVAAQVDRLLNLLRRECYL